MKQTYQLCMEHICEAIEGNGLRAFNAGDTIQVVSDRECKSDLHDHRGDP